MLGYSVSYFLSQYWRNVPLYAEKLIPLLDTCLSNNFVYSDKVSGAFYELINKYQNTAELPLENLKEFIREQGYGYILDLMIQDEENIKLLWYLLVLIHQLKGSREGLELVLSLFSNEGNLDTINYFDSGAVVRDVNNSCVDGSINLLTQPLTVTGACPIGSGGTFTYILPEGNLIQEEGTYSLEWTNISYNSLGKLNSFKVIAHRNNLTDTVLFNEDNLLYAYPQRVYNTTFNFSDGDSPINSITFEFTCDNVNQIGACISGIKVSKDGTTFLPIEDGVITTDTEFYQDQEVHKAFQPFNIEGTGIIKAGELEIDVDNLPAGNYTIKWDLIGGEVDSNNFYIDGIDVALRYSDWDRNDPNKEENTLDICHLTDLTYNITNKEYSVDFRALKNFKIISIQYSLSGSGLLNSKVKGYLNNVRLIKDLSTVTIKAIPDMTSDTIPSGLVKSEGTFKDTGKAYKAFNYSSPYGCSPTSNGVVRYVFDDQPSLGDYTFTWCNNSTNNNGYLTSMKAKVVYINNTEEEIYSNTSLVPVLGKERINKDFTATNSIKELVLTYTTTVDENGDGGNFQEVNIIKTEDGLVNGSKINVWHETTPVETENTFYIESDVDVAKTGIEFFYNFKNFVRNYVYPELKALKVRYSLEGAQAIQIYSVENISYQSFCDESWVWPT